jgi:hypothetical protein
MKAAGPPQGSAADGRARLLAMINANWMTQALAAAAEFRLPDLLAAGPRSAEALADATGAHAPSMRRMLRALASIEVVAEQDDRRFALAPLGELLRENAPESLHAYTLFRAAQGRAWEELTQCVRSGEGYRKRALGRDDFAHLDNDAPSAALFHRAMVELTRRVAGELLRAYDFGSFECVVDVGGGYGELVAAVLAAHPSMRGILYDLGHARAGAEPQLSAAGVAARCEFHGGSFFDSVPTGGDLYLLKSILHDWDDERCALILRQCRRAMSPNARLLVIERLAPERVSVSARDQTLVASDLNMLVALSGRERSAVEYADLLDAAGLSVTRIVETAGAFSAIEAKPAG